MSGSYDVAIVGLGAMGSSAAYQLARRGQRVVGFDRDSPPHDLGSSHGESRIIREAYFEHPLYVPIVQRAYECWRELEEVSGHELLLQTGGLLVGPPDGVLVGGARFSADRHGLDYTILDAKDVREKYPVFDPDDDMVGLFEPRAGVLLPERCVEVCLALARQEGTDIHLREPVVEWEITPRGVRVTTEKGCYEAGRLLLAPGPWLRGLLNDLDLPLAVERQVLHWFQPADPRPFAIERLPIYACEFDAAELFYGFPELGSGVKVALHHQGEVTDVESIDREVHREETALIESLVERYLPPLAGAVQRSEVCMYTNTPDEHFLIDFHPRHDRVLIASACSGHGFKFASVIGEILADLLTKGETSFDLSPFRMARLLDREET